MATAERNDEAPNSASLGAMGSLLRRLDELPCTDDGESISELKDDIQSISDKLMKLSKVQDSLTVNYWMKHARDLSYDIEAYLDGLKVQRTEDSLNDSDAKKEDNPVDSDIKLENFIGYSDGFKTRAKGMIDRYKKFSLDSEPSYPTAVTTIVCPRPRRDAVPVRMNGQITNLVSPLQPKDENTMQLKIVSIHGDEGSGKSTLVQEIWRQSFEEKKIKRAFVRMGKNPDVTMILRSILSQVSQQEPEKDSRVINLIGDIRKHLEKKRYFVIVDDVRSLSVWDVVSRAFPDGSFGSRIITTTSDEKVALACCSYVLENKYKMEPLSEEDSELLFRRTVGLGTATDLQISKNVLDEINRKCGRLPLAIIWAAILVASKLETVQGLSRSENELDFLDENLRTVSTPVEKLTQLLKLCYSSLPHYLKTCLLYFSLYPENYGFLKEDLVKLWMAEGFICTSEEDKVEAAGRYFDVLVSLGLIQRMEINCNYQHHQGEEAEDEGEEYPLKVPYTVHPKVFDFITSKITEDNFISVIDYSQLTVEFKEKIRRLSLHFGTATYPSIPESIGLSYVRTLSFMGLFKCMPSLLEFKLVRVLILHIWAEDGDKMISLPKISSLLLLRYLQVRCNVTVELAGQIGCLKHMETLEINSVIRVVPSDVFHLSGLMHLRLGLKQNVTAGYFAAVNDISSDELLPSMDDSSSITTHTVQIRELLLTSCIFSKPPKWIEKFLKLSILEIVVRELLSADIDMLAKLPALTALSIYAPIPTARSIVIPRGTFRALIYFRLMCGVLSLDIQQEAMPNLRQLLIRFNVRRREKYDYILTGIQHLLNLQEVVARIGETMDTEETDMIAAKSALNDAIDRHPHHAKLKPERVHRVKEEPRPPPLDPLSINDQEEVPVIQGLQTEDSTNEQPKNIDKMAAKDKHEHATFSALWNANMVDRNVDYSVLKHILDGSKKPGELPLEILTSITDNFSEDRKIGRGRFSDVYKGVLDGWTVAVKKIRADSDNIEREDKLFYREVECLLNIIEHRNVVRFLGFCSRIHYEAKESPRTEEKRVVEITERLLCFEYISSGSLEKHITDELRGLDWDIRYQIIYGICEGLQYLHNDMGIIHMDLKPANILVDMKDMVPKITDFGLARLVENNDTTGVPFVSRGYCAPEYMNVPKPTLECDIYSLGILIKEIVTGRKELPNKDSVIRRWRCRWRKLATDTTLHVQQITKCVEIAERCTQEDPKRRPSIFHIIRDLNESANTNVCIPAANQISSWDYSDMMHIEPLELRFAFDLNKEISNEVVLTNDTGNYIAFNIKTSSQQYHTQPNKGIVPPRSKSFVNITLTTLRSMTRADEFIVQSTKVEGGFTDEEITEEIFNEESGTVVDEVNLTVIYDNVPEKPQADQSLEAKASVSKETAGCSSSKDVRLNFRPIETTLATIQYKASQRAAVDIMTGAMGRLLPKLDQLLKEVHNLPEDMKESLKPVKEGLTDMYDILCDLPPEEMHKLGQQDKNWVNKVKSLSYDVEDMVDDLLISSECTVTGTMPWGWARHPADSALPSLLQEMLRKVRELAKRSKGIRMLTTSLAINGPVRSTDVDPRMLDWYKDHKYLVGIDGPRDSLVGKLTCGDDASKKKLMILSIFGEGGLGKTTLAKKVFDKLAPNFLLKAFVPVGRNPVIKRVLQDILFELDKEGNKDIHNAKKNKRQLIDLLREQLKNKRYFIIIDDIWDTKSWEIIKCALIDNANGSRVMTTSRINDVTKGSGEGCKLEPLSYDQSKQLFYSRLTYTSTNTFDRLDEQSTEYILEKCRGLPLAIIVIASLLDGKPVKEWPKVYNSIKFGYEDNRAENTEYILLLSYFDLPYHLKTCLLYLSIYPEDIVIDKRTLVWKWIAEGFVQQEKRKTLFEVGEGYFNELIKRSLIQPVDEFWWDHDRIETGSIGACRVHDMVLDLVCSKAKEENFVAILDTDEKHLSSLNNARILAVHKSVLVQRAMVNTCIEKVRSFNADGCNVSRMGLGSLLPRFQFLRVLSFQGCVKEYYGGEAYFLKSVAQLRHLRFLSLAGTFISKLPMEIGDLRCLQILDLMDTEIRKLPQSVTQLRELKSLLYCNSDGQLKLPVGMGSLTSLEELRLTIVEIEEALTLDVDRDIMEIDNSSDEEQAFFAEKDKRPTALAGFLEELGNLTELRVLHIYTRGFSDSLNKALVESLNKLKKIEELEVRIFREPFEIFRDDEPGFHDTMWDDYLPCKVLLRHLSLYSYDMPVWIDASLENVVYLQLDLRSLTVSDLSRLGSLPQLRSLDLRLGWARSLHGTVVADSAGAFPKLRHLQTECWLTFVPEAMQCLEYLRLTITMRRYPVEVDFDSLQCLHSLKNVSANFDIEHPKYYTEGETLKAALRRAVNSHPNGPSLIWSDTCHSRFPRSQYFQTAGNYLLKYINIYAK